VNANAAYLELGSHDLHHPVAKQQYVVLQVESLDCIQDNDKSLLR
jgi:hypothetical protein